MKASEIRNLSIEERKHKYLELKKELYSLRNANKISRVENPNEIKQIKKDIARIKTILNEEEKHEKAKK